MKIIHLPELGFSVVINPAEYHVDFEVLKMAEDNGIMFYDKDGRSTVILEDAARFLHGHVKWDGCSNWQFDEQGESMMIHFCERTELERVGKVLTWCYDWTMENLEKAIQWNSPSLKKDK